MPDVPVIEYIRPNGVKQPQTATISQEHFEIYQELNPILEAELIPGDMIAIYGRLPDWNEEDELTRLAHNTSIHDKDNPNRVVETILKQLKNIKDAWQCDERE